MGDRNGSGEEAVADGLLTSLYKNDVVVEPVPESKAEVDDRVGLVISVDDVLKFTSCANRATPAPEGRLDLVEHLR